MKTATGILAALLSLASLPLAAAPRLHDQIVSAAGDDAIIQLYGSDGCRPGRAAVTTEETGLIVIEIEPVPPGTPCFSAPVFWTLTVVAPDLDDGNHQVDVRRGDSFGEFAFDWPLPGIQDTADLGLAPSQGMWWSSARPGTGMAFNIDDQGRWFAALYLYDDLGAPTFLTMQGASLTYEPNALPPRPYAAGISPLIRSEGGQCLRCAWRAPATSDTGDEAVLVFHSRNRATLSVAGGWKLDLSLLPRSQDDAEDEKALPQDGRQYVMIMDGATGRHAVVVRAELDDTGISNMAVARFHCIDCRTVDGNGNAAGTTDQMVRDLVQNDMTIQCIASACTFMIADDHAGTMYVDDTGSVLTTRLASHRVPSPDATNIELRLLPDGWRD